jgi:hypothetical protein
MISGDASLVADWNTFFDLPANGTPFTSVDIVGNAVNLIGGAGITLRDYVFGDNDPSGTSLVQVVDNLSRIVACGTGVFSDYGSGDGCYALTKISLPACTVAGDYTFADCESLTDVTLSFADFTELGEAFFAWCPIGDSIINSFSNLITIGFECFGWCPNLNNINLPSVITVGIHAFAQCNSALTFSFENVNSIGDNAFDRCGAISYSLPACTALGSSVLDNHVFALITGKTITLTVKADLMTCNGGNPDGDIQYLQANNTVTVIQV